VHTAINSTGEEDAVYPSSLSSDADIQAPYSSEERPSVGMGSAQVVQDPPTEGQLGGSGETGTSGDETSDVDNRTEATIASTEAKTPLSPNDDFAFIENFKLPIHQATDHSDVSDSEAKVDSARSAWAEYDKQYKDWYETHGKTDTESKTEGNAADAELTANAGGAIVDTGVSPSLESPKKVVFDDAVLVDGNAGFEDVDLGTPTPPVAAVSDNQISITAVIESLAAPPTESSPSLASDLVPPDSASTGGAGPFTPNEVAEEPYLSDNITSPVEYAADVAVDSVSEVLKPDSTDSFPDTAPSELLQPVSESVAAPDTSLLSENGPSMPETVSEPDEQLQPVSAIMEAPDASTLFGNVPSVPATALMPAEQLQSVSEAVAAPDASSLFRNVPSVPTASSEPAEVAGNRPAPSMPAAALFEPPPSAASTTAPTNANPFAAAAGPNISKSAKTVVVSKDASDLFGSAPNPFGAAPPAPTAVSSKQVKKQVPSGAAGDLFGSSGTSQASNMFSSSTGSASVPAPTRGGVGADAAQLFSSGASAADPFSSSSSSGGSSNVQFGAPADMFKSAKVPSNMSVAPSAADLFGSGPSAPFGPPPVIAPPNVAFPPPPQVSTTVPATSGVHHTMPPIATDAASLFGSTAVASGVRSPVGGSVASPTQPASVSKVPPIATDAAALFGSAPAMAGVASNERGGVGSPAGQLGGTATELFSSPKPANDAVQFGIPGAAPNHFNESPPQAFVLSPAKQLPTVDVPPLTVPGANPNTGRASSGGNGYEFIEYESQTPVGNSRVPTSTPPVNSAANVPSSPAVRPAQATPSALPKPGVPPRPAGFPAPVTAAPRFQGKANVVAGASPFDAPSGPASADTLFGASARNAPASLNPALSSSALAASSLFDSSVSTPSPTATAAPFGAGNKGAMDAADIFAAVTHSTSAERPKPNAKGRVEPPATAQDLFARPGPGIVPSSSTGSIPAAAPGAPPSAPGVRLPVVSAVASPKPAPTQQASPVPVKPKDKAPPPGMIRGPHGFIPAPKTPTAGTTQVFSPPLPNTPSDTTSAAEAAGIFATAPTLDNIGLAMPVNAQPVVMDSSAALRVASADSASAARQYAGYHAVGRPTCPIVAFGFGGVAAIMIPQARQLLNPLLLTPDEKARPFLCGQINTHRIIDLMKLASGSPALTVQSPTEREELSDGSPSSPISRRREVQQLASMLTSFAVPLLGSSNSAGGVDTVKAFLSSRINHESSLTTSALPSSYFAKIKAAAAEKRTDTAKPKESSASLPSAARSTAPLPSPFKKTASTGGEKSEKAVLEQDAAVDGANPMQDSKPSSSMKNRYFESEKLLWKLLETLIDTQGAVCSNSSAADSPEQKIVRILVGQQKLMMAGASGSVGGLALPADAGDVYATVSAPAGATGSDSQSTIPSKISEKEVHFCCGKCLYVRIIILDV
jgi:hypothetical protein